MLLKKVADKTRRKCLKNKELHFWKSGAIDVSSGFDILIAQASRKKERGKIREIGPTKQNLQGGG